MKNHEFVGNMNPENIVIYDIVEDWGVSSDRCLRSTLKNHKHIEYLIKKLWIIFDDIYFFESIFLVFLDFTIILLG